MYQFYYADHKDNRETFYKIKINDYFHVSAIRPTMWEEHCLECSAPLCYKTCPHYIARSDGRCKRFYNSIEVSEQVYGCNGESARIKFREWANMMTIIFPEKLSVEDYLILNQKNNKLGKCLRAVNQSKLPVNMRWQLIRTMEYLRRRKLRKAKDGIKKPDAFILQTYNFENYSYKLIFEVFDSQTSIFRTSFTMKPGENFYLLENYKLDESCWNANYLIKIYPENNLTPELDILWCDFVWGNFVKAQKPAEKVKCLVWDLDNTLWDGILIETDNPDDLVLKNGVLNTILELDARGILQSISSKNDYENAWPVLERLGVAEYFLYPQINWNVKSSSMVNIAKCLNIGIDSLALIDDSEFERREVKNSVPEVRTYDALEINSILGKNEFLVLTTDESRKRRSLYKEEESRQKLKTEGNYDQLDFLKKCNLSMKIFTPQNSEDLKRCYELVVRTNQLNMSGIKYTVDEFNEVLRKKDHVNFAFSCEDDFGSYGVVGFGQYIIDAEQLIFTEFAMSCRVAGKMVESALFSYLLQNSNCKIGLFSVNKTQKNSLLRRTLENIGFKTIYDDEKHIEYSYKELLNSNIVRIR